MALAICETCGNEYDKTFQVIMDGTSHTFDSFECALSLAPRCAHCDCRILGHGLEEGDEIFCCAHCARESGIVDLQDRAPSSTDAAAGVASLER